MTSRVLVRPERRGLLPAVGLALAALVFVVLGTPLVNGKLAGGLTNSNNTAGSGSTCKWAITGTPGGPAEFGYPFGESGGTTANDVSSNNRPGTYTAIGVTYGQPGPCPRDGTTAITLNSTLGVLGYVSGPATAVQGPNIFSIEIWFKTTSASGKLIGFGSSRTGLSTSYDRHLYIDATGHLVFGVYPNAVQTIASTATVTNGVWHNAIGTLSGAGMALYLDGNLVASNEAVTTAQTFSGYWRIGYDSLTGWTNPPLNSFFVGSLAYASQYNYALTAAQALQHYRSGV